MTFQEVLDDMRESIQGSLDELSSPRSSSAMRTKALKQLERHLATACIVKINDSKAKDAFIALQHTFECNIPSHLLPWISVSTIRIESLTSKASTDDDTKSEVDDLASQLTLSLSLLQGIVLNHPSSKVYLGRKCSLETLLDLLLASRHLPSPSDGADSNLKSKSAPALPHLTSIVLDTLLCVLVDSTMALRAFEEASGVQAVVKILKRAGTPREVRMKCLEFLYFYLLDETPSASRDEALKSTQPTPPPTAPATPIRPKKSKPYLNATPLRPASRYGSSTFSFTSSRSGGLTISDSSVISNSPSLRSASGSSTNSFSSTSSNASSSTSTSTPASSIGRSSPVKEAGHALITPIKALQKSPIKRLATPHQSHPSSLQRNSTPPNSPPLSSSGSANKFPQMRSMMLLRKEVDYVPQSPKKVGVIGLGVGRPGHQKSLSCSTTTTASPNSYSGSFVPRTRSTGEQSMTAVGEGTPTPTAVATLGRGFKDEPDVKDSTDAQWKTTEEKKELLGTMLGNVDALVEGVRKAGIWGLG